MSPLFYRQWFDSHWPGWAGKTLRLLLRLVRTKVVGVEQIQRTPRCCIAHWHGDDLSLMPRFGHLGVTVLVSQSKDGEIIARAMAALGYRLTRGSSSRGAVGGLLALIKEVREEHRVGLTVDGPQGPRGVCKPGIVRVAQKTGAPIFPMVAATSRKFVFKKTWNQTYLPLPFSRQVIYVGEPLFFPKRTSEQAMHHYCRQVEEALRSAQGKAERILQAGQ